MKDKGLIMNEDMEMFITFLLFPPMFIFIICFIFSLNGWFAFGFFVWIVLYIFIYRRYHCRFILKSNEKIVIYGFGFNYIFYEKDIAYLLKIKNLNFINNITYEIIFKEKDIPKRYRIIKSKKIEKLINNDVYLKSLIQEKTII